jgi:hypothetical protein
MLSMLFHLHATFEFLLLPSLLLCDRSAATSLHRYPAATFIPSSIVAHYIACTSFFSAQYHRISLTLQCGDDRISHNLLTLTVVIALSSSPRTDRWTRLPLLYINKSPLTISASLPPRTPSTQLLQPFSRLRLLPHPLHVHNFG